MVKAEALLPGRPVAESVLAPAASASLCGKEGTREVGRGGRGGRVEGHGEWDEETGEGERES